MVSCFPIEVGSFYMSLGSQITCDIRRQEILTQKYFILLVKCKTLPPLPLQYLKYSRFDLNISSTTS
jgi:hypothetical protein